MSNFLSYFQDNNSRSILSPIPTQYFSSKLICSQGKDSKFVLPKPEDVEELIVYELVNDISDLQEKLEADKRDLSKIHTKEEQTQQEIIHQLESNSKEILECKLLIRKKIDELNALEKKYGNKFNEIDSEISKTNNKFINITSPENNMRPNELWGGCFNSITTSSPNLNLKQSLKLSSNITKHYLRTKSNSNFDENFSDKSNKIPLKMIEKVIMKKRVKEDLNDILMNYKILDSEKNNIENSIKTIEKELNLNKERYYMLIEDYNTSNMRLIELISQKESYEVNAKLQITLFNNPSSKPNQQKPHKIPLKSNRSIQFLANSNGGSDRLYSKLNREEDGANLSLGESENFSGEEEKPPLEKEIRSCFSGDKGGVLVFDYEIKSVDLDKFCHRCSCGIMEGIRSLMGKCKEGGVINTQFNANKTSTEFNLHQLELNNKSDVNSSISKLKDILHTTNYSNCSLDKNSERALSKVIESKIHKGFLCYLSKKMNKSSTETVVDSNRFSEINEVNEINDVNALTESKEYSAIDEFIASLTTQILNMVVLYTKIQLKSAETDPSRISVFLKNLIKVSYLEKVIVSESAFLQNEFKNDISFYLTEIKRSEKKLCMLLERKEEVGYKIEQLKCRKNYLIKEHNRIKSCKITNERHLTDIIDEASLLMQDKENIRKELEEQKFAGEKEVRFLKEKIRALKLKGQELKGRNDEIIKERTERYLSVVNEMGRIREEIQVKYKLINTQLELYKRKHGSSDKLFEKFVSKIYKTLEKSLPQKTDATAAINEKLNKENDSLADNQLKIGASFSVVNYKHKVSRDYSDAKCLTTITPTLNHIINKSIPIRAKPHKHYNISNITTQTINNIINNKNLTVSNTHRVLKNKTHYMINYNATNTERNLSQNCLLSKENSSFINRPLTDSNKLLKSNRVKYRNNNSFTNRKGAGINADSMVEESNNTYNICSSNNNKKGNIIYDNYVKNRRSIKIINSNFENLSGSVSNLGDGKCGIPFGKKKRAYYKRNSFGYVNETLSNNYNSILKKNINNLKSYLFPTSTTSVTNEYNDCIKILYGEKYDKEKEEKELKVLYSESRTDNIKTDDKNNSGSNSDLVGVIINGLTKKNDFIKKLLLLTDCYYRKADKIAKFDPVFHDISDTRLNLTKGKMQIYSNYLYIFDSNCNSCKLSMKIPLKNIVNTFLNNYTKYLIKIYQIYSQMINKYGSYNVDRLLKLKDVHSIPLDDGIKSKAIKVKYYNFSFLYIIENEREKIEVIVNGYENIKNWLNGLNYIIKYAKINK